MEGDPKTARQRYERLHGMAPSPKLVFRELTDASEPLTAAELSERTLLSRRTVRYALNQLEDAGLIESKPNARDARTRVYSAYPIERPSEA